MNQMGHHVFLSLSVLIRELFSLYPQRWSLPRVPLCRLYQLSPVSTRPRAFSCPTHSLYFGWYSSVSTIVTWSYFSPNEDFIALLGNLSLLQLIFASWNINASLSLTRSGMSFFTVENVEWPWNYITAPLMAIFIIFGSCILLFSLAL